MQEYLEIRTASCYYSTPMEHATLDTLLVWLTHYGPLSLYVIMALGIIAFPVPEETLMVLAGVLIHQGKIPLESTAAAAILGAMTGITVSYLFGYFVGKVLLLRWGSYIGIGEKQLNSAHEWFERFGKWALFIGYFIPGVRHFTGVSAGITGLEYYRFAIFAYMGAICWGSLFISIGYFLGGKWFLSFKFYEMTYDEIFIVFILIALAIYAFVRWKRQMR